MTLYYFGNHRTDAQLNEMKRLEAEGICLFCPPRLTGERKLDVVHKTLHWIVIPNRYPYRETKLHYLLVPDEHVTDMADLSAEAQQDFWAALAWVRDHHCLAYYGVAVRNGECEHTGGTIRHVHVHLVQGDVDNPSHQGVRVRLSSRPSRIQGLPPNA